MEQPNAASDAVSSVGSKPPVTTSLSEFLEEGSLYSSRKIRALFSDAQYGNINYPDALNLHCDHAKCQGVRRHVFRSGNTLKLDGVFYSFALYECVNCQSSEQIFGIKSAFPDGKPNFSGICTKIYQEPAFGLPIPKRLFQVIGETNREYFLQARRAIARGLGVGAYAYYRRIVENTKFDLISAVLEVAQATNAPASQIQLLTKARSETQFSKAIEMLSDVSAVPPVLLIDGHNPLTLLHDLLSEGIHEFSDAECLQRARDAEVILSEIADRMQIAMTERKTVKAAISSIMNRKTGRDAAAS